MSDDLRNLLSIPVSSLCCVCRLCAAVIDATSAVTLFVTGEDALVEKIRKHLPIQISESDPFPKTICKTCVDQIQKFDNLADKCVLFEEHLRRTLHPGELEDIDIQAALDRELKNLKNCIDVSIDLEELEYLAEGLSKGAASLTRSESTPDGPCRICGEDLPNFDACLHHQRLHINEYRCVVCNFKNDSDIEITTHLSQHFDDLSPPSTNKASTTSHFDGGKSPDCDTTVSSVENTDNSEPQSPADEPYYSCSICLTTISIPDIDAQIDEDFPVRKCKQCQNIYNDEKSLKKHCCVTVRKFKCSKCGQRFKTESRLRFHEDFHENKQTYCVLCKKDFKFESRIFIHLAGAHNGERDNPFCCDTCGRTFRWMRALIQHKRTHTNERTFSCQKCEAKFFCKSALVAHLPSHELKRLHCMRCEYSTSRKLNLQKHISRFHKKVDGSQIVVQCIYCHELFPNSNQAVVEKHSHDVAKWDLKNSLEKMIVTKLYQCERCNRNFASDSFLNEHRKSHEVDDQSSFYRCRLCVLGFNRHDMLVRHQKVHQNVTSLYTEIFSVATVILCNICGLECVDYTQLSDHKERGNCIEKVKKGLIRPRKPLTAPRLQPLKVSQLNINSAGLFECLTCKRIYKSRRRFRLHLATHDSKIPSLE